MSDKIELNCFPSTRSEALTMLYLQNQDLTNVSPQELVDQYVKALDEVKSRFSEIRSGKLSF